MVNLDINYMNKKTLFKVIRIIIGVLILGLLLYSVDISKIYENLIKLSIFSLILFILTYFVAWFFTALTTKIIISPLGFKINFFKLFRIRAISWCIGQLLPGRIGEFSLVYLLKKQNISTGVGGVIFVLDNIITLVILFLISIIGFFTFFTVQQSLQLIAIVCILFIIGSFFIFSKMGRKLITKHILRKYSFIFEGFSKNLFSFFSKHYKYLILNLFVTLIKWVCISFIFYLLIILFGGSVPFHYVFLINSMTTIISLIPITLSGLGLRETSAVYLYSLVNVDGGIILTIQLIYLFINYIFAFFALTLYKK
jgi:uncharacterized protein (TIRG00374 family)